MCVCVVLVRALVVGGVGVVRGARGLRRLLRWLLRLWLSHALGRHPRGNLRTLQRLEFWPQRVLAGVSAYTVIGESGGRLGVWATEADAIVES